MYIYILCRLEMNVKIDGQFESWVAPNFRWSSAAHVRYLNFPTWRCLTRG